jgi:hypothetical protein
MKAITQANGAAIAEPERDEEAVTRHRVQLDFSPGAYKRLRELREKADARTNADLVRNALRLYEWYLNAKNDNYKINLIKNGEVKEVEIMF